MKPGLGWMHIKDYRHPQPVQKVGHVDEDAFAHFVPADFGDSAHETILRDFSRILPALEKKLRRRGVPGVFLDLEPHVKGGGNRRIQRPGRHGRRPARPVPRARLRGHRLPSPRFRRRQGRKKKSGVAKNLQSFQPSAVSYQSSNVGKKIEFSIHTLPTFHNPTAYCLKPTAYEILRSG